MKILVSRISIDNIIGGAELSARDICRSLIKLGHFPLLATNLKTKTINKDIPSDYTVHIPIINPRSPVLKKILRPIRLITLFLWYLFTVIKLRPDILNPQSREDQVVATWTSKILGIPVVWRDPGDLRPQLEHKTISVFQNINRVVQQHAIANASHIITLNQDDRKFILSKVPALSPHRISVIKSNVMFNDYDVRRKRQPTDQGIVIGCASRLEKHKGVQYLIEAFAKLQIKYNNRLSLIIAGTGHYQDDLKNTASDTPGITFMGLVDDISIVLNQIDIFVQPSEFEGWGRGTKEAKYFKKPIVASRVGGIKKQIKDGRDGLLTNPGDIEDLKIKLDALINDPKKRIFLAKNAYLSAMQEGDWTVTVDKEIIPLFKKYVK